ncbi:MAG: LysR family transcriptional regulator [Hyphomicrobiaceae bacterium]|nr:LysR family transcriptional regulator [Hyphomicrobiaceae bacterium]MCC0024251.1 LysR family transcriptional regulator [Hyphomicrobiaceae bacterium]
MPLRHATLRQLAVFRALAQHQSVARAAEALHLTPPAVSIQVKQLSEHIGHPLIGQTGKKLYLTAQGEAVASACRDLLDRLERLDQDLAALKGLEQGSLSVAIITTASYFVPRLLGDFHAEHPGLNVSMFVGNRQTILERMERNEDDLYILGQPPDSARVTAWPFAPNPLVAIASPDHPLRDEVDIDPKRLAREPFIAREGGSGTRLTAEEFFAKAYAPLQIRLELGSNEAVKQSVAGHMGFSVLSESTVRKELASGELVKLDVRGMPLERKWYAAHPRNKVLSPAALAYRDFLDAHFPRPST